MSDPLPPSFKQYERFSQPSAERSISERFRLSWDPQMQDWDLINSNPEHLPTLLDAIAHGSFSDDEHFSLMCLAISSYDDLLQSNENQVVWYSLEREILRRPTLYASIVWYWAQPVLYGDEPFPVSERMAKVWKKLCDVLHP